MKYSVVLLALVAVVTALPTQETTEAKDTAPEAERRRLEITFCRRENFEDCDIIESAEKGICNSVPDSLIDRIRSISFHGSDQCTFYNQFSCTGTSFTDAGSVPELHRRFRDRVSSYQCT